jgi:hypothetical protein
MPSQVDSGNEPHHAIAKRIYSHEFLNQLAKTFNFDLDKHNARYELRKIAEAYIVGCRNDGEKLQKELRHRYRQLSGAISDFAGRLNKSDDYDDIATEMHRVAIFSPLEASYMDDVIVAQKARGDTEFLHRHLLNLLELLTVTAKHRIKFYEGTRGRRKNRGLQAVIMKGHQFWAFDLDRKFSIDHHHGTGLTDAFQFVRALIEPFGDRITDTQIITAMRAEISRHGPAGLRPNRKALIHNTRA